jgi:hypothetical protein
MKYTVPRVFARSRPLWLTYAAPTAAVLQGRKNPIKAATAPAPATFSPIDKEAMSAFAPGATGAAGGGIKVMGGEPGAT